MEYSEISRTARNIGGVDSVKEGSVVVMKDQVAGTVVSAKDKQLWVLTKNGFIRVVNETEVYPYQLGQELKEENDVGTKHPG